MKKLPKIIVGAIWIFLSLLLPEGVLAVAIATQDQAFGDQLNTWEVLQELGNNLSGILTNFTFRVSTSKTNLDQFDFTVQNSRIYDKDNNNSYITACTPPGYNPSNPLDGLTFNTSGVDAGFEDVTIDFSCRNYEFIPGHRYLILVSNANMAQFGGKRILFAAGAYGLGGHYITDQFSGGGLRYAFDNGFCSAAPYVWNSQGNNNGCNIWTSAKDDLYFILNNKAPPPPPPKLPVIFIPGIGGSELKTSQDIIWSKEDGHGGTYSHAYPANEKVWVNDTEAQKLGDDDYFDVLRLKTDGQTSEADLSLTGNLTSFGYGDIDSFFTGMGYEKGKNYFIFAYDWRKDVGSNKDNLDSAVEQVKTLSGQTKVNLVVHSMGGLIARYYISDSSKAAKINKLIELGVPHLGATFALKTLVYGTSINYRFKFFEFPIIPASEVRDVFQNLPSVFQLLPSNQYFNNENISPFRDDRDIDNNRITGVLNYDQTKNLLSNLSYNMTVFGLAEQFHNSIDPVLNQTNGTKVYEIVGTSQPTLGQIHETWWITWPINLIPKTDEIFINGDDTVPILSGSLKSNSQDLSDGATLYYVEQKHSDLVSSNGTAMQTVKAILNKDSLPVEVKSQKFDLEGQQISLDDGEMELYDDEGKHTGVKDNGEIETNIAETFYTTSGKTKHAFIKKKAKKVTAKVTRKGKTSSDPKTTNIKIRTYKTDKISKTVLYKDLPVSQTGKAEFTLDPTVDTAPTLTFYADVTKIENTTITPTSEVNGSIALDQTPPTTKIEIAGTKDSSGIYNGPAILTLTGADSESGILRIEYSLDNGTTVQAYTNPFTISTSGKTTLQVKSIDKLGNEEIPQSIIIEIASSTSSSSSSSSGNSPSNSVQNTSEVKSSNISEVDKTTSRNKQSNSILSTPDVLGVTFENPSHISDQINISHVLDELKNPRVPKITGPSAKQVLGGLLVVSVGIIAVTSLGLTLTFLKPTPK